MVAPNTLLGEQHPKRLLHIPDTLKTWPWRRVPNPHEAVVDEESKAWMRSFPPPAASPRWADILENTYPALLAGLVSPAFTKEQLRVASDLILVYFIVDDYTDSGPEDLVPQWVDIMMDALNNPRKPRPMGEEIIGQIIKEFAESLYRLGTPTAVKHFIEGFTTYLDGVMLHVKDRENTGASSTIETYLGHTRRSDVGSTSLFVVGELPLHIPDEVVYHPVIREMQELTLDMIIIDNDMTSYNAEQAIGEVNWNIVTVAMRQFGFDVNAAMKKAYECHLQKQRRFMQLISEIPLGSDADTQIFEYVFHLANWVQGNHNWNFETRRYFGDGGPEIQCTRVVELYPTVDSYADLKRIVFGY